MARFRQSWFFGIPIAIWAVISVALTGLAIVLAAPFMGGKRAFFTIGPWWAKQLFRLCDIPLVVEGWDALPEEIQSAKQPVIFMSNHESNLDPPVLIAAIPIPAVYLSKKELKWVPLVGWASQLAGVIFIDRSNRERSFKSLRAAADQIRGGKSVVIFPEGTRTRTGKLGAFKKGGFALAQDAGVPIVPLATVGGYRILKPGALQFGQGRYVIRFGQPVDPGQFPTRESLLKEVEARVSTLVAEANGPSSGRPACSAGPARPDTSDGIAPLAH